MKVGIIQSNYIPWRGYFKFIQNCDQFIFHDDIQYTKQDWRNRNKIRTYGGGGTRWLTIPVGNVDDRLICEVEAADPDWHANHRAVLKNTYHAAKYCNDMLEIFDHVRGEGNLSSINQRLTAVICAYLGIGTMMVDSRQFNLDPSLKKTDRLVPMLKATGATVYLSGPAAQGYLDVGKLAHAGIVCEWMDYSGFPEYPQVHGGFFPAVSALDLIANVGPEATYYLTQLKSSVTMEV